MAGEYLVLNPRRKHRRTSKRRHVRKNVRKHRRLHARRNPVLNRRRYSPRRNARRHVRRHRIHRNPAMRFFGVDLGLVGWGALGVAGSKIAGGWIYGMLPAEMKADTKTAPMMNMAAKAAAGIGLPMLLKQFKILPAPAANAVMVGAGIGIAVDLLDAYVLPALGLGSYEEMTGIESPIELTEGGDFAGAYGGSPYA